MSEYEKFEIGMALHKIALSLSEEDFQNVKGYMKRIEKIVAEQTEPTTEESSMADCSTCTQQADCPWK